MYCQNPECDQVRLLVFDSRYCAPGRQPERKHRRRRYRCPACGWRYATVETIVNVRRTPG